MSRWLIIGLVACLSVSSLHAQSIQDSIANAATEAAKRAVDPAAQLQQQTERRIPRGFLWTGIGLLGAGGLYLAIGAAAGDEQACTSFGSRLNEDCISIRKVGFVLGGVLAGTGGALLGIGVAKSHHSPSISFLPGGMVVRQQVPLTFARHRSVSQQPVARRVAGDAR